MRLSIASVLGVVSAGLITTGAITGSALTIQYQATDLVDVQPGKDLWRYTYYVSDYAFQEEEGFDIYFDKTLYANLTNPQPDNGPQWIAAASIGPGQGPSLIYDALTLEVNPSLAVVFSVDFEWLGQGGPGSQPFDGFRPAAGNTLEVFGAGMTAPVPDTGSTLMLGSLAFAGLAGIGFGRKLRPFAA
jgi:hypothetical protein